ncbi:hypothetical protein FKW77_001731 [Venturia effusa]|uniref:DUF7730 domain-containing protein n=1 Tax=Venturia effusa TaxID=50376 RepID=A0A517L8P0_9PEZI|nr:hypothetical protein FKW77_001731 [Venturia effusa]
MPLCIGFKDRHPVYEPLTERPPTARQFTRPDVLPAVDLEASLSAPRWNGSSDMGFFNKLPRELRDRIYRHALVATLGEVDAKIMEILEENGPQDQGVDEFRVKLAINCLSLKGKAGISLINENIGLLQTNKQIHAEAIEVFYSENVFTFFISETKTKSDKHKARYTDWVHSRHFEHIRHVYLCMVSDTAIEISEDGTASQHSDISQSGMMQLTAVFNNLTDFVALLHARKKPLKSLHVRFATEYLGDIESVYRRDHSGYVTAPLGLPLTTSMPPFKFVTNCGNQMHAARPGPNGSVWISRHELMPFQEQPWVRILDPIMSLRALVTHAEVSVRAELPQQYVQEICDTLTKDAQVSPQLRQRYEHQRRRREKEAALEKFVNVKHAPETFECFLERVHGTLEGEICEHGLPIITPMGSEAMDCIAAFQPPLLDSAPEPDDADHPAEDD